MITCQRAVFIDSEFDAKKGKGERPGPPTCICAIEVFADGREIEHRLAAPIRHGRHGTAVTRS